MFLSIVLIRTPEYSFAVLKIVAAMYLFNLLVLSQGRLPERIVVPLVLIAVIVWREKFFLESFSRFKKKLNLLFLLPIVALASVTLDKTIKAINYEQNFKNSMNVDFLGYERIIKFKPNKRIIAFSSFYSSLITTVSPMEKTSNVPEIWTKTIPIGWSLKPPKTYDQIESMNLTPELFRSVAHGDAYLAVGNIEEIMLVNQYLKEHYSIEVEWPTAQFVFNDTGLGIWEVKSYSYVD